MQCAVLDAMSQLHRSRAFCISSAELNEQLVKQSCRKHAGELQESCAMLCWLATHMTACHMQEGQPPELVPGEPTIHDEAFIGARPCLCCTQKGDLVQSVDCWVERNVLAELAAVMGCCGLYVQAEVWQL